MVPIIDSIHTYTNHDLVASMVINIESWPMDMACSINFALHAYYEIYY